MQQVAERWRQAQQLFDRIIDLPADERAAELARACGDDAALLDMVAGLIAADAEDVPEPEPAIVALGRIADPEYAAGTRIGAFKIERLLGTGGMGRVYLGSRADGRVEQLVAIKTIAGRDLLARFERERRILAKLNHPHVAHFVDAGECADGSPFFAMEYIAGTPLLEYVLRNRLNLAARLRLFVKIVDAVDYAHRQLVVHRDLKPGNVLIDASGEPKLLDFGIAKPIQQQQEALLLSGQTAPESRYFSLRHAAPEQLTGESEGVSIDIYALGGMLYELLSGQPALDLENLSLAEAQARITREMPKPPSVAARADLPYSGALLRGDLDRIVLHALKKEPEQRYASAAALLDDLNRVLDHRPISLRASHRWYLLARFLRRHRLATSMAAALMLVTVGAAAVYRQQRDLAVQERTRAEVVNTILIEAFEGADPSRNQGEHLTARDVLKQARHVVSTRTDLEGGALTALLVSLSEVHESLGLNEDARALAQRAISSASNDDERMQAKYQLMHAMSAGAEGTSAMELLSELRRYPAASSDPSWKVRLNLMDIELTGSLGKIDVVPLSAETYRYASATLGPDAPLTESAAATYAERLIARASMVRQGADFVRVLLSRSPEDAVTPERLALLRMATTSQRALGDFAGSMAYAQRSLQLAERLYGKDHVAYVGAESQCARALRLAGKFDEARELYSDSVERARRVSGPESMVYALAAHNAGEAALNEPLDLARALEMSAIAVDVGPRAMPADSRKMGFLWSTRAEALLLADDAGGALDAALRSSAVFQLSPERSIPMHAEAELLAAAAEAHLGRADEARARVAALGNDIASITPDSRAPQLARAARLIPGATP